MATGFEKSDLQKTSRQSISRPRRDATDTTFDIDGIEQERKDLEDGSSRQIDWMKVNSSRRQLLKVTNTVELV